MSTATFAYAQARLQARHAQRPGVTDWRLLQGVGDAVHFLQVARRTRLRRWVLTLQGALDSHHIESILRRQFQDYIDEVLRWLPPPWDNTADWLKRLPELPAIQYLLGGGEPLVWMQDDPRLSAFTSGDYERRLLALRQSDCAPLVSAWQRGESITAAWFSYWRTAWAHDRDDGLEQLAKLLQRSLQLAPADSGKGFETQHEYLFARLTAIFRRGTFQPAAGYAHLALTALDLMMLRAELLQRVLFPAVRVSV